VLDHIRKLYAELPSKGGIRMLELVSPGDEDATRNLSSLLPAVTQSTNRGYSMPYNWDDTPCFNESSNRIFTFRHTLGRSRLCIHMNIWVQTYAYRLCVFTYVLYALYPTCDVEVLLFLVRSLEPESEKFVELYHACCSLAFLSLHCWAQSPTEYDIGT
jgi:hypothetical protein